MRGPIYLFRCELVAIGGGGGGGGGGIVDFKNGLPGADSIFFYTVSTL